MIYDHGSLSSLSGEDDISGSCSNRGWKFNHNTAVVETDESSVITTSSQSDYLADAEDCSGLQLPTGYANRMVSIICLCGMH
jgi:hypothetical protein